MYTQQPAVSNICIHISARHTCCKDSHWKEKPLHPAFALADICFYGFSWKSNHQMFVFTMKMLSCCPIYISTYFGCACKYLIHEAVSPDPVWKLMPPWRDVSAAFWMCEAQQTAWLISCVLTLWLMISVLVAHLSVDHNLSAQCDIARFNFYWSGLFSAFIRGTKKKKLS